MQVRRIREIVIVYTLPGDDTPRELRIANAEGQVIDGLIWSRALVERLRYAAGEGCVPPKMAPGAKFKFITFKGGGEAGTSVAGGHTHFTTENLSEGLALVEGKKLRVLALTSQNRMPQLPDIPTATEAGSTGGSRRMPL